MKHKNTLQKLSLVCWINLFLIFSLSCFSFTIQIHYTNAVSSIEAYNAITSAYEKVEQISRQGLDTLDLVIKLNDALNDYYNLKYEEAYTKAIEVEEQANDILSNYRWGKLVPYVLIPLNIVILAAIVVFFGRRIINWFKKSQTEEFLDLELSYPEEDNTTSKKENA